MVSNAPALASKSPRFGVRDCLDGLVSPVINLLLAGVEEPENKGTDAPINVVCLAHGFELGVEPAVFHGASDGPLFFPDPRHDFHGRDAGVAAMAA